MSAIERFNIEAARHDVNRAMSMLSCVVAGLRLEDDFQDEYVNRPIRLDPYIPTLGEMIDTVLTCHELLSGCWTTLHREVIE